MGLVRPRKSTLGRACNPAPLMEPEPTRYPKHGPHAAQAPPCPRARRRAGGGLVRPRKPTLGRACTRAPLMWPEPPRQPKHAPHAAQARPAPAAAAGGVERLGVP